MTTRNAIFYQSATELARLIGTRELSSREVVQAHLDRIAAVNPKINAVVTLMADSALASADAADKAVAAGAELGPLHGVPFTIKDTLDTAGVPSQRGSRLFLGHLPERDATAVARFKAAGGIALAKTNIPEFASWTESDNLVTGRTNNPWNLERTAGGSTGGEGAMIAAGLSPIGIGSDVAISVRGPAAFNGIAALKATHGRVPYTGHFPTAMSKYRHVGPMARTVGDVALGYRIMDKLGLAYLYLIEPRVSGNETNAGVDQQTPVAAQLIRRHCRGVIIAAGGFTPESAAAIVAAGDADLVAFGRHFISNPDLPARICKQLPLARYNRDTFYGGKEEGYADYPEYAEQVDNAQRHAA